jgi:hypothetical protein
MTKQHCFFTLPLLAPPESVQRKRNSSGEAATVSK